MKIPQVADVPEPDYNSFHKRAERAKKRAAGVRLVKLSSTITEEDEDYLRTQAAKRGQERRKLMNTSEALREILAEHRSQQ